jgi:hypothetical protein
MRDMNWMGELGFYDAADFAPSRVVPEEGYKVVRCWMAHHQGMSLLAACNLLTDGGIQKLFHSEPAIRATELLLHEKPSHATHPFVRAKRMVSYDERRWIQALEFGVAAGKPLTGAPAESFETNDPFSYTPHGPSGRQEPDRSTPLLPASFEVAKTTLKAKRANSIDRTCA